ncbi:MAG: hypothetical protein Q4F23_06160, partial [Coriobacteriia bacterium]|nr:hypothetical protein [Coriobacteriia bacterium]
MSEENKDQESAGSEAKQPEVASGTKDGATEEAAPKFKPKAAPSKGGKATREERAASKALKSQRKEREKAQKKADK